MIKKQLVLIFISIFLISCLEVDSSIAIKKDGTGIWDLQYRISQEAIYITPGLEFSGFNYFPTNENEIRKRINEIMGLGLLQISVRETADFSEFYTRMSFQNTDDIKSFLSNSEEKSLVEISSDNDGSFSLKIKNIYIPEINQDTLKLLSALYPKKMINIIVSFPGIVTDSSTGFLSKDPEKAAFEMRTIDALTTEEPVIWTINYE